MKILVVMKNWLGDLLFQMPAIELIKNRYPASEIFCVAPERCREILEAHPGVSGFIVFDEKSTHRSWLKRVGFILKLRKLGPWREGYLFHRSRSRAAMLFLAGVKKRVGYGKGRGFFLTVPVREPESKLHQLDYFMELMKSAGFETPVEPRSRFYYKPEDESRARAILKENGLAEGSKYICLHLGANWEPKRWPAGHFAGLAGKVYDKWNIPAVVTGSPGDRPLLEEFLKDIKTARVIDLVGKTSLRVSACIYKDAVCLVTGDSGPMHIASGVGARVVSIFGPTDPDLTGPRGVGENITLQYVPSGYSVPFFGKKLPEDGWLSRITPDEVFEAVGQML